MIKQMEELRDKLAQEHWEVRVKKFDLKDFSKEIIATESYKRAFDDCYAEMAPLIEALQAYVNKNPVETGLCKRMAREALKKIGVPNV